MRQALLCAVVVLCFTAALVADGAVVELDGPHDSAVLNPAQPAWYFGELAGDPHTYTLQLTQPSETQFEVLVPKVDINQDPVHAAIVVRQATRGVEEVARLRAEDARWTSSFNRALGSRYRHGSAFKGTLEPGNYIIEVHSPDNQGAYILRVGESDALAGYGYGQKISFLYDIKRHEHEGSLAALVAMLYSPYVYIPLIVSLLGVGLLWRLLRKRYA